MAKAAGKLGGKLQAVAVRALVTAGKPGAHADGGNLYLRVAGPASGKWTLRYMLAGKAREMGLGAYDPDGKRGLTLAEARAHRRVVETEELERRLAALEAKGTRYDRTHGQAPRATRSSTGRPVGRARLPGAT